VVKGRSFVSLRDAGDPVECGRAYSDAGADELVFLDITATLEARKTIRELVSRVAEQVFIPFTVGGGIRGLDDIRALLKAGADKVSINTAAVRQKHLVREGAEAFGAQCIVVAVDAKQLPGQSGRWEIYTHGGRKPTGIDAIEWVRRVEARGAGEILLTSMDRDGTKVGFDLELTRAVVDAVPVPVIASGGVGALEHLVDGIRTGGADAVLAASIFHYGEFTVGQAKALLAAQGIAVRQ